MENINDIHKMCTLTITPCVWIRFRGVKSTNKENFYNLPMCPNDGGLVGEFIRWCFDKKIYPIDGTPGTAGGGIYSHAHHEKDKLRIFMWFKDKGVQIDTGDDCGL